jgi:hypothetical protein
MEKRFLHEDLRRPQTFLWRMQRAFCDIYATSKVVDGTDSDGNNLVTFDAVEAERTFLKYKVGIPANAAYNVAAVFASDPTLTCLANISSFFLNDEVQSYVFTKEFWPVLRKTSIKNISWDALPDHFTATFRWPEPLVDADGDLIEQMMVVIRPRPVLEEIRKAPFKDEEGEGSRVLVAWWLCHTGSGGYFCQMIPDRTDRIIPDNWSRVMKRNSRLSPWYFETSEEYDNDSHIVDLVKSLIYVSSGDPDLRAERNPIQYKDGKSSQPVRKHKDFSEVEFHRVGWNWKKMMERRAAEYSKDSWTVEPFPRYQPYGPRDSPKYKWIIVEGHERRRSVELRPETQL